MSRQIPASWFANAHPPRPVAPLTSQPPEVINRRITLRTTDHPSTDRHVTIRTYFRHGRTTYTVAVVNGFGAYPSDAPTPRELNAPDEARAHANRLLDKQRTTP